MRAQLTNNESQALYSPRFSPDGRTLYAALRYAPDGSSTIQRYDARSGRVLGAERAVNHGTALATLIVTRDGERVVTSFRDGPTVIRDARTLRPLKRLPVSADQAALSPDDRTLLVGRRDGSVRFVDLVTGNARTASGRHGGGVVRAAFSADGRTAVTAGEDGRVIVWNVTRAAAGETLQGYVGQITALAISRDSRTLYTSGLDGKVLIWDLAGAHRLGRPFALGADSEGDPLGFPGYAVPAHSVSPDGRVLAIGQRDGTVNLIDARTLAIRSSFRALPNGPVRTVGYVPRSGLLAVGGDHGFLALFDPRRGELVKSLPGHRGSLLTVSFSADGRLMASASNSAGAGILLWALPSGRRLAPGPPELPTFEQLGDVSLSADGRTLAVAEPGIGVDIVDVATGRRRASLRHPTTMFVARFTPDGRSIVGGSFDGSTRLWSTKTWRPVGGVLPGHTGAVLWESISPDDRTLATGSLDGTVRLLDLRTQQPIGAPLPGLPNRAVAPLFTPDGAALFAITGSGRAYRWDVRPSAWARHACVVAGRALSRGEWKDALPDRGYAPACSG